MEREEVGLISKEERNVMFTILQKEGYAKQVGFLMEECGELFSAINKYERGRCNEDAVITELADVSLVLSQFINIFGYEKFLIERNRKFERLKERLNK